MLSSKFFLISLFGLGLFVACGDGDGGTVSVRATCEKGCALRASLACPNDDTSTCVSECEQGQAASPAACQSQTAALLECAANRPSSDWECDEEGEATPKQGVCSQEVSAAISCILANRDDDTCAFENDGECDDPTGTDLCPAGTDLADCS